jgi:hypothetical protein
MKRQKLLVGVAGLVMLIMAACQGLVQRSWTGVYVSVARGEYSVAEDTLTLSLEKDGSYSALRSTGFCPVRDGKLLAKRSRSERFTMVLDASGQQLSEPLNGRVYRLDASGGLVVGKVVYRRLN